MSGQETEMFTNAARYIVRPTPEEDADMNAQIAVGPDDFELDDQLFENAKSTQELFPETCRQAVGYGRMSQDNLKYP